MAAPTSLARGTALCAALLILWGANDRAWAGPRVHHVLGNRGLYNGSDCTPKAMTFGHHQSGWREWPAELRPDRTFPQSIGAEPLPTPQGVEEVPLPVETLPPAGIEPPAVGPKLPALPTEGVPGPGEILPPDRKIRIEDRSPLEPAPETPSPLEPPAGDMLPPPLETPPAKSSPRLPLETPPAETSPRLPLDLSPPAGTSPRLPLEPAVQQPKELPAEPPRPGPSGSGRFPSPGGLPTDLEPPAAGGQPAKAPPPKDKGGANMMDRRPPAVQENVPVPVEPWAKPRPWRPEPARQATYQAPIEPWPQPRKWEPRVERPVQRPVEQPAPPSAETSQAPPGLDGYCPVRLAETEQWVVGDPRWAVSFQGQTYLTSGPDLQRRFLANPGRYAPVFSGQDPVLALDENTKVPGQTEFCVVYDGRLYMFTNAGTLARFHQNPKRYAGLVAKQAQ